MERFSKELPSALFSPSLKFFPKYSLYFLKNFLIFQEKYIQNAEIMELSTLIFFFYFMR